MITKFIFDGHESKYKFWEVKFLRHLRVQPLHQIILSPTDESDHMNFVEKNAVIFAELIQCLDDRSLLLIMWDT